MVPAQWPPSAANEAQRAAIKRATRDAFYTDTDAWKARIVGQGLDAVRLALNGLGG